MISKRLAKYVFFGTFLGVLLIPASRSHRRAAAAAATMAGATKTIGAALAMGISALGAGWAQAKIGSAGQGTLGRASRGARLRSDAHRAPRSHRSARLRYGHHPQRLVTGSDKCDPSVSPREGRPMAIEDILRALDDQAQADCDEILGEAREHAKLIVEEAERQAQADSRQASYVRSSEWRPRTHAKKVNAARLEAKMIVSSVKGDGVAVGVRRCAARSSPRFAGLATRRSSRRWRPRRSRA